MKFFPCVFAVAVAATVCGAPRTALAQSQPQEAGKVLYIVREVLKPGKDGAPHEKTEGAYIQAMRAAKGPLHYMAMTSMSGESRALFFSAYPSFQAMEDERKSMSVALQAALDRANVADGELLSKTEESAWLRRDDLSSNTHAAMAGTRYMEVSQYLVKPGHEAEFVEAAKMYVEAVKDIPELHWTAYQEAYGGTPSPAFLVLSAYKTLSEVDATFGTDERFAKALGPAKMKRLSELMASSVEQQLTNLFALAPKMSLPSDAMVKAEPDYWMPKAAPAKK